MQPLFVIQHACMYWFMSFAYVATYVRTYVLQDVRQIHMDKLISSLNV